MPAFQEENQPLRTVRVVLVLKSSDEMEKAHNAIRSASELIEPQVGIRFSVIKTLIREEGFSPDKINALNELAKTCSKAGLRNGEHFDIAVGFSDYTFKDSLSKLSPIPVFVWDGAIDDNVCRCYYVTKTANRRINAHELMHAFILDFDHDETGLMTGKRFELIPGLALFENDKLYLSPKSRESVLKHKWRDFSGLPRDFKRDRENNLSEN